MQRVMTVGLLMLTALIGLVLVDSQSVAQRATATRTPTPLPTMYVTANANGRECPRLDCDVIETYVAGESVEVIGTKSGDSVKSSKTWYEVRYSHRGSVFIHSSLLTDRKPTARATQHSTGGSRSATATPAPGETVVVAPAPTETQPPSTGWNCSGDIYNCSDFSNRTDLMSYFNACPGDPSKLDNDNDGVPCESLH